MQLNSIFELSYILYIFLMEKKKIIYQIIDAFNYLLSSYYTVYNSDLGNFSCIYKPKSGWLRNLFFLQINQERDRSYHTVLWRADGFTPCQPRRLLDFGDLD